MRNLKNINLFLIFLLIFASKIIAQDFLPVIPQPQEVQKNNKKFFINNSPISIEIFLKDTSDIYIPVNELKETFRIFKQIKISFDENSSKKILIGIPGDDENFKELCESENINFDQTFNPEGYKLLIDDSKITIAAKTKAGIYYGVQTLKQLIRGNVNKDFLNGVIISDWPELKYRGILDDISRGPVPTMEYMKQQIRRLAELKMNSLQYYTENVVKTKSHGDFAPPDGSLTIEDWRELSNYGKKYHVMLIGNFQSFGHFEKILAHPNYSHLGEGGTVLSPVFPESIKLLKDIYSEMVPAFDAPFFNVNSDETFDLGKGPSRSLVDSLGVAVVYTDQIKKMHDILKNLNVKTMMWTDILLKHPESLEMLPKDIIMMTWGYDADDSFAGQILPVKNAGYKFTISPGILNSYSTMPDFSVAIPNIHNFVRDGINYGAIGMVCTVWDDGGSAFFSKDWYGVSYAADQSWNSTSQNISEFDTKFNLSVYGDTTNSFTTAIWKLVSLSKISASDRLQEKILWTKVIPDNGESIRVGIEDWDRVVSVVDSAENILNNAEPILHQTDLNYFRFTVDQYRYFANLRFNLIDAAKLYQDAYGNFNINKSSSREKIVQSIKLISDLINRVTNLYNDYRILWLKENKTHAVNDVLEKYQSQKNDLKDIEERIFSALKSLDSGSNKIPEPSDVRLGIEEATGKYFKDWMMINPIPNENGSSGTSIDYLKEMGGEKNAVPKIAQEFMYNDQRYRWRRTYSDLFDVVDLTEEFPKNNMNSVTYAYASIQSPDDRIVTASLGSTAGIDVFLNGDLVYTFREKRDLVIDENKFQLSLKKGKNHLLLKLFHGTGDWKFTFQLPNYKTSNSKNRYKIN